MGQKNLYNNLFGFRIIINIDFLKWEGQCPKLIQALEILIIEIKQKLSLIICLRSLYEILSGLRANKLLYLLIVFLNSFFKKDFHSETDLDWISSKMLMLTW